MRKIATITLGLLLCLVTVSAQDRPAKTSLGSPYVPLDSWVYPAMDRLAAFGYLPTQSAGQRPWTRRECARLVGEAEELMQAAGPLNEQASSVVAALRAEFAHELGGATAALQLDSLYSRFSVISGQPLVDGYHFGQTLTNDYGRPYGQGANNITGVSAWGAKNSVAFYIRGEYQYASPLPTYSDSVRQLLGTVDQTPSPLPFNAVPRDQVRLLDAYAAWNFKSVQVSVGRQSLWWGPNRGGPLLFSNNAQPMDMLRISKTSPAKLPSVLGWLGPMRWDFFFGAMADHHFPANPAMHGEKISFKPTPNLEFGFSRTLIFKPVTISKFVKGFVSVGSATQAPGSDSDVGDRRGGFDFSYRIPGLRKWLVVYNDAMTDDDPSPLSAPRRSIMNPGIYLPQIPKVNKLDFRVEAPFSDTPFVADRGGRFFYWNGAYRDGYTNGGQLLGSWVGRQGRGLQLWSTYWFSSRSTLQVGFRDARVASEFIPKGGRIQDVSVRADFIVHHGIEVSTFVQFERWKFPVLASESKSNTTASVQLTYRPQWGRILPTRCQSEHCEGREAKPNQTTIQ